MIYTEKIQFQTKNDNFEQSHSAEKSKKGDPLGFLYIYYVVKYFKN